VSDIADSRNRLNVWAVMAGMFRKILELVLAGAQLTLSRRGLHVVFLMMAIFLTATRAGWLRPPLSPDIRSIHMPLGIWKSETNSPEEILQGPRRVTLDSAGGLLLTLIASGTLVVLWRPQRFGTVAGLLLCGAICANSAAAFNHPALIELMDLELEQRQQIDKFVLPSLPLNCPPSEDKLLVAESSDPGNARIGLRSAPAEDEQCGDLGRGWDYLLYGQWLALWAVVGILLGGRGSLRQRLACLSRWVLLGMSLTGVVCFRRLYAEYHWEQAKFLEAQCDYSASRRALRVAIAQFPEFDRLERTWLLAGKLDYREGHSTPREHFFRAYQIARDKEQPRRITHLEDLPCLRPGPLYSPGDLSAPPSNSGQGKALDTYHFASAMERFRAINLMSDLLAEMDNSHPAVRNQVAQLWSTTGLDYYRQDRLMAAQDAWQRALQVVPWSHACAFFLGTAQIRTDRAKPELAEAILAPTLTASADRTLRADIRASLGFSYFEAGQLTSARKQHVGSLADFKLPKIINFRGLKGIGGL
jgi:tetratricopeptide (TPR) repeat protein